MNPRSIEVSGRLAAFVVASTLMPGAVFADASPANVASAKALLAEGRELRAKGEHAKARDRFKAAWALVPTTIIGVDLAREHVACGELIEGREIALEVTKLPENAKESVEGKAARAEAAKLAADLKSRIPAIVVKLQGVPIGKTAHVTIDGEVLPTAALGAPRKVNPGPRMVVARVDDVERSAKVTVAEGAIEEVVVSFEGSASIGKPVDTFAHKTEDSPPRSVWPLVSLGVGAAGVITGTVFAVLAVTDRRDINELCPDKCPPVNEGKKNELLSSEKGHWWLAGIVGGVGLAALGIGAWGLLRPARANGARIQLFVGTGVLNVRVVF